MASVVGSKIKSQIKLLYVAAIFSGAYFIFPCSLCSQSFSENRTLLPNAGVSNNGNYVFSTVKYYPDINNETLVIRSTVTGWKKEIPNAVGLFFSSSNNELVIRFLDCIGIIKLGDSVFTVINNVKAVKFSKYNNQNWIAYQLKDSFSSVVLYNIVSKKNCHI